MELEMAQREVLKMMDENHLDGWGFQFDRATHRFGQCRSGDKMITLSRPLVFLNTPERVRLTIIHEVAHALTPGHHHDWVWKQKCKELGGDAKRCFTDSDTITPKPDPERERRKAELRIARRNARWELRRKFAAEAREKMEEKARLRLCTCPSGYHNMFIECRGY